MCLNLSTTLELRHLCKSSAESGAIYVIHRYVYEVHQCLGRRNKDWFLDVNLLETSCKPQTVQFFLAQVCEGVFYHCEDVLHHYAIRISARLN